MSRVGGGAGSSGIAILEELLLMCHADKRLGEDRSPFLETNKRRVTTEFAI